MFYALLMFKLISVRSKERVRHIPNRSEKEQNI